MVESTDLIEYLGRFAFHEKKLYQLFHSVHYGTNSDEIRSPVEQILLNSNIWEYHNIVYYFSYIIFDDFLKLHNKFIGFLKYHDSKTNDKLILLSSLIQILNQNKEKINNIRNNVSAHSPDIEKMSIFELDRHLGSIDYNTIFIMHAEVILFVNALKELFPNEFKHIEKNTNERDPKIQLIVPKSIKDTIEAEIEQTRKKLSENNINFTWDQINKRKSDFYGLTNYVNVMCNMLNSK